MIAGLILFSTVLTCSADEGNLLKNGSFEEGIDGWHLNSTFESAVIDVVSGQPGKEVRGGNKAVRITNSGAQSHFHQVGGLAGRLYELTFWARAGSDFRSSVSAYIYEYGHPDAIVRQRGRFKFIRTVQKTTPMTIGSHWQEFTVPIQMGNDLAGATHFNIAIGIKGDVVLDNIVLQEVQTWQEALIFHLPFEDSFDPVHAAGKAAPKINGMPTFTRGKKGRAAMFFDNANIVFGAEDNFDQSEGTLAMWVQPYWIETDGLPHCFFEVPVAPEMFLDGGYVVTKGWSEKIQPNRYYHYNSPGHNTNMPFLSLETGEWTHMVFTWSSSDETMGVYRNGELIAFHGSLNLKDRPPSKGRPMVIGARLGGIYDLREKKDPYYGKLRREFPPIGAYGADAAIDELMIFSRVLTDTEIATLADRNPDSIKISKRSEAQGTPERHDGSHMHDVQLRLKTPHIKFNHPAANPIKTLFVTPAEVAPRDIAELSQRVDIEFDAVITAYISRFAEAKSFFYHLWKGTTLAEKTKELSDKLAMNPEVIVVGNFEFDKLPEQIQSELKSQVSSGAGLVVTFPRRVPAAFTQNHNQGGRDQILEGIPLAGMSECFPSKGMTREAILDNVVKTFNYGKGRVAVVHWDENPPTLGRIGAECLVPPAISGRWTRQYEHRYNYYLSLVGKAVQWAARQNPKARWITLPSDGQIIQRSQWPKAGLGVDVAWNGIKERTAVLTAVVRDDRGRVEAAEELTVNLKPGTNSIVVPSSELKCGNHYLDLRISTEGQVENWATVYFKVEGSERIDVLTTDSDYYERGETVKGKARFVSSVSPGAELAVQAVDTNGRVYNRINIPIRSGVKETEFQITVDRPTTLASYIEADVIRDGEVLACAERVIFIPKRNPKEFLNLLWCTILNEGIGQVALRQLRKAGFNAVYHWNWAGLDFHNDAMADMMPAQYCTRIVLEPDDRGWSTSKSFGVEDSSFANPKVQDKLRQIATDSVRASGPLGPPFYSLGDENFFRWGIGYSPYGLEYFRKFLKKRYGTISKLNDTYGSDYVDFKNVPRYKIGDAISKGLVPALIDHRLATDEEWAEYFRFSAEEFKKIDPHACVGAEGSEPGDLERTLAGVGFWGPYHSMRDDVLQRSLQSPDLLASHWWGGYGDGAKDCTDLWRGLICGFINFQEFFASIGIEGSLNRDFSYRSFLEKLLPELQEIYAGPALLLRDSKVISSDSVVIHYSRSSIHASLALKNLAVSAGLDGTLVLAMNEIGQDFRYASGNLIGSGHLLSPEAKILFMPASYTLSQDEADGITDFVRQGGTVVADMLPGVLDEFGKRLTKGRLDEVFGVTCNGITSPVMTQKIDFDVDINSVQFHLAIGMTSVEAALSAKGADPLVHIGETPLMLVNKFGTGKAILLNFDLSRSPKFMRVPFVKALLQVAGVQPTYRLDGPGATKLSVLERGDMTLLGVIYPEDGDDGPATISWDTSTCVYNMRKGQYLGSVKKVLIPPSTKSGRVHLFTLQKEPVHSIDLTGAGELSRGESLRLGVNANIGEVNSKDRLIRIEVTDPKGNIVIHYRDFVTLSDDSDESIIPFAFNDTPGTWTIQATDVATALSTEKKVVLR